MKAGVVDTLLRGDLRGKPLSKNETCLSFLARAWKQCLSVEENVFGFAIWQKKARRYAQKESPLLANRLRKRKKQSRSMRWGRFLALVGACAQNVH
jgi:hypothetical protein